MTDVRAIPRALDALRRGWPVTIAADDGIITVLPVETADAATLALFEGEAPADLLLSHERAATLKIIARKEAAGPAVRIEHKGGISAAIAVADPSRDLANPFKGPFRVAAQPGSTGEAALDLARIAGLLPAFFIRDGAGEGELTITAAEVGHYADPAALTLVTRAQLPIEAAENVEIIGFRHRVSGEEHVALLIGKPNGEPPLVRLHSECLTGDVFGSLKCDCGPQLHAALARIAESGWGILLYMRQEGRGIGLINKLRTYELQDQGFDTVDANVRLGFAVDERDFGIAAGMLKALSQSKIRLLTNNPSKVAGLEAHGVTVVERASHQLPPNPHNERYLATKRDRTGHQL